MIASELILSFVPASGQRLWRTITRRKYRLTHNHGRLQNQLTYDYPANKKFSGEVN